VSDGRRFDTHIALWLDGEDRRLRPAAGSPIDGWWQGGGTIGRLALDYRAAAHGH